ncbi:ATP-dependent Clp protease ATP-binding subunit [Patescibacteria group bacterium]|nr:ATP-dependent Clp protease ATP-binding subunit [Patescibacteria group bacterium]
MNDDKNNLEFFQKEDFFKKSDGRTAVLFLNHLLFFGQDLKLSLITLRRLKKRVDAVVNFLSYLLGVAGLLSFCYWFYLNFSLSTFGFSDLFYFWKSDSIFISFFLVSIIFDAFIVYRISEKKFSLKKIKKIKEKKVSNLGDYNKLPKIDISLALSEEMLLILENSYLLARKFNQKELGTLHLFWLLCESNVIKNLLVRLNVDINRLLEILKKYLDNPDLQRTNNEKIILSDNVQEILLSAFYDAYINKHESIGVLNVVSFCYEKNELLQEILYELDISQNKIKNAVKWFRINDQMYRDYKTFRRMARLKPGSGMNKAYTAIATPTLDYFSRDLTVMAKYGYFEACVARDKEMKQIFEAFESEQNGVLLIGSTGTGKRSMIEGLAQLMVKEEVPKFLKDKRLVELDLSRLISGASPSVAEERMMIIINEILRSKNVILYIENIQNMMGITAGSEESLELSEVLAETLSRQNFYCLASVSTEDYSKYLEGRAISNVMAPIKINEPEIDDVIFMLESKISWIESKYGIYFDYNSLEETVNLSSRYINDKFLPDKAVNIIKSVAVRNSKLSQKDPSKKICTKEDIAEIISDISGIPVSQVSVSESEKLLSLEEKIHERMIGQEEAVIAVSGSLRRSRAQIREGSRPIASFLFLGPTGVGKTELAKSVSEIYFGAEDYMIRLDMSEYQLFDSVKKMIGDVDGTLGYLTEAVRKKPFSLILFDEVEKAHPDILNLFLQILDDGRLTDGQGRTINFTNSIIIATSNAGSLFIQEAVKNQIESAIIKQELIDNHLNKIMRPELINRFDGIIVFKPLTIENILAIAKIMVKKIAKSLEVKGVSLLYDDDGLLKLAEAGYDPKFGARPLRRLLQDKIENEIANLILAGSLKRRDTVFIDENGDVKIERGRSI